MGKHTSALPRSQRRRAPSNVPWTHDPLPGVVEEKRPGIPEPFFSGPGAAIPRKEVFMSSPVIRGRRFGPDAHHRNPLPGSGAAAFLVLLVTAPALWGQDSGSSSDPLPGGSLIPLALESLEHAYGSYLAAWDDGNPAAVLSFFAPKAQALIRSGLVDGADLPSLIALAVPSLEIRRTSIYLVEDTDGWVTVGSYVEFALSDGDTEVQTGAGSKLTVWESDRHGRWRVVFWAALWLDRGMVPFASTIVGGDP
jgi:hypothetical protein